MYVRTCVCMHVCARVGTFVYAYARIVRTYACVRVRACATRYDQKHDIEQVFGSLDVPSGFELFFEIAGTCLNWEVAHGHTECNCRNT